MSKDMYSIPCGCGGLVYFLSSWSKPLQAQSVKVEHRGGFLFEWIVGDAYDVIDSAGMIVRNLVLHLDDWTELKSAGGGCSGYWTSVRKVMEDAYRSIGEV